MDNDVIIYKTAFSNQNKFTGEVPKLMTSWDCL